MLQGDSGDVGKLWIGLLARWMAEGVLDGWLVVAAAGRWAGRVAGHGDMMQGTSAGCPTLIWSSPT